MKKDELFSKKSNETYNYLRKSFKESEGDPIIFWMAQSMAFSDYIDFLLMKGKIDLGTIENMMIGISRRTINKEFGYMMGSFIESKINKNNKCLEEYNEIIARGIKDALE